MPAAAVAQPDEARRQRRPRRDAEEKVVATGAQLGRTEHLDLHAVALSDLHRLLGQGLRSQLVGRRVLPFACAVGRLTVFLRRDDLVLAPDSKTREHELVDLTPLGLRAGLSRAPLEGAHDTALYDVLQRVHPRLRLGPHQAAPLVSVRARRADELVMGRTEPLAFHILRRATPIEDDA